MEDQKILALLHKHFPIKSEIIGESDLYALIDKRNENIDNLLIESKLGRNLDYVTIITSISIAIQVIDFVEKKINQRKSKSHINNDEEYQRASKLVLDEFNLSANEGEYDALISDMINGK
jgi:hypothetical protein